MRTLIEGGWVVGYHGNGHELIPKGSVVFEEDRIVHVGRRFEGPVDRRLDATGKLVSPGFVNCHLHAATNASQAVFLDGLKADYFGSNFVGYAAPRRGAPVPRVGDRADVAGLYGLWSALRAGATTILDVGTMPGGVEAFTRVAGELGVRAYLGPAFRSAGYAFDGSRVIWEWNEEQGMAGLERAVAYVTKHDGAYHGRIRAMLYPGQMDTCTLELLKHARRAADELGVPMQFHAAMNLREFHQILERHGKTPIELLDSIGFLKPKTGLGHCVFHNRHSWCHYPYGDDLRRLASSGVTVVHAPYKYAKMGIMFESFERYRALGINIAIGTDTYPQDVIHEMRWAALVCRMADGNFRVGRPQDVFDAATLGGARFLGRDDLGRLQPGAKADIIVVDLRQAHYGAVHDPIKSLVESGHGRDVETVIVDGEILLEAGKALRLDEAALLAAVETEAERLWHAVPEWHWSGKTLDEIAPPSYPVRE
ncbi:MAG TPA: chlorohydrolase family protein [Methylomirabilota bacterium]|jgi:cytosine/adenosine deaminase-related metal-dependent hydrolase|nr:chlorohydrolase family protein [Methylomirabilota bacterium]